MSTASPKRVLVTGAGGQLAGAIIDVLRGDAEMLAYAREELDIADLDAVMERRRAADRPDVIINCAAYNDVDEAEDDPQRALTVNALAVRVLARAARKQARRSCTTARISCSTDTRRDPIVEEDAPNPQSVYAQSKLLGEWFALEAPRAFVLRVESLFGGKAAQELDRSHHRRDCQR